MLSDKFSDDFSYFKCYQAWLLASICVCMRLLLIE